MYTLTLTYHSSIFLMIAVIFSKWAVLTILNKVFSSLAHNIIQPDVIRTTAKSVGVTCTHTYYTSVVMEKDITYRDIQHTVGTS